MPAINPTTTTKFSSLLATLHRAPVRALAWSCFAEPILSHSLGLDGDGLSPPALPLTAQRRQWLQALDADPKLLLDYLARHCPSRRLGLQYEALWHFFLLSDPQTRLIAHNIPVRDGNGRSLGEFDVLYQDLHSGDFIHLELAVKFFLELEAPLSTDPLSRWLGPNSADRLDRKLARLHSHQLPLAVSQQGKEVLANLGVDRFQQQLRLGGILFHSREHSNPAQDQQLNPYHQRADWIRLAEHTQELGDWRILAKPDWLSARYQDGQPLPENLETLVNKRPLMLIHADGNRRFLVGNHWPTLTPEF